MVVVHKPFRPKSVTTTGILAVRLHRDLLEDFLAACVRELGPMKRKSGSSARAVVIERLIRQYIADHPAPVELANK